MTVAEVRLWGTRIGAVALNDGESTARFEYDRKFLGSGIEIAPLTLPLRAGVYAFPALPIESFHGLPGLLADSLPDRFGNALINAWLASKGRSPDSFSAVERLRYVGQRGTGALEYSPVLGPKPGKGRAIKIDLLTELASEILTQRETLDGSFLTDDKKAVVLQDMLRVGTSAGGARAKALIAWNPKTGQVRSGQISAGDGFEYWLLKFDGVAGNRDRELADPAGYGRIEYAYHLMAETAGIQMMPCRLLAENGRSHFMTRRFDRLPDGAKLHMLSLAGMAHFDFNAAGAHAYEQALDMIRRLDLGMTALEEQYRRMVFNILGRNHDDHVKNIAFLMDKRGVWQLSPAFDLTYSYNPTGQWTARHQMTVNGKQSGITHADLQAVAKTAGLNRGHARAILEQVQAAIANWSSDAAVQAGVPDEWAAKIAKSHLHLRKL